MRRETPTHAGPRRTPPQPLARGRRVPGPPARAAVDHAEQPTDRHRPARTQPWLELLEAPIVHPDLATPTALAATHQHRPAAPLEVELSQIERLLDAKPGAPQDHDQATGTVAVQPVAAATHHLDDLLRARRIRRVTPTLAARTASARYPGTAAGERRRPNESNGGKAD